MITDYRNTERVLRAKIENLTARLESLERYIDNMKDEDIVIRTETVRK